MSKGIVMQESGIAKQLTVDALRTSKQGGGSEDWLPTDETNLVELDIGGSGTYRASDYNAYGISVARVTPKYGGGATSKAAQQPVFSNMHTPAIREGGNPKYMSARLMKTNLQGGGTCLWVPEDEVNLESKYVDHSGTYPASADNCYGYSQITVSGVDVEITQDDDGDDVAEITDGGETRVEKLPSYIEITTPPIKLNYTMGETIDYTGLVVHAYTNSGIDLGKIPFNKLILPVAKAGEGWKSLWTDGHGLNAMQIAYTPRWNITEWISTGKIDERQVFVSTALGTRDGHPAALGGEKPGTLFVTKYKHAGQYRIYLASMTGVRGCDLYALFDGEIIYNQIKRTGWFLVVGTSARAGSRKFEAISFEEELTDVPESTVSPSSVDPYTLYATGEYIPVQWHRPVDGLVLETSFEIRIMQAGN